MMGWIIVGLLIVSLTLGDIVRDRYQAKTEIARATARPEEARLRRLELEERRRRVEPYDEKATDSEGRGSSEFSSSDR